VRESARFSSGFLLKVKGSDVTGDLAIIRLSA